MRTLRTCVECGRVSRTPRCPQHQRAGTVARGYGAEHKRERAASVEALDPMAPCWRCDQPLGDDPSPLNLDHNGNRSGYEGLTHALCNQAKREPGG